MSQFQLSARAYHCILKLSRTIADLAGEECILFAHLAETLQYCPKGMIFRELPSLKYARSDFWRPIK